VPFEAGELKAVGFIGGKKVSEFVRRSPAKPVALRLVAELLDRPLAADGADAIFVRAEVVDELGEIVRSARVPVTFAVNGSARIVSPAQAMTSQDGTATMLLQAGTRPGKITVTVTAEGLLAASSTIVSKPALP